MPRKNWGGRGSQSIQCYKCQGFGHFARDCGRGSVAASTRDPERRFFDKVTKDNGARIASKDEALRLLKAAVIFAETEGASALLYRLCEKDYSGIDGVRKSLEFLTDVDVFLEGFVPFIKTLGRDELSKPVYATPLAVLLRKIYAIPFFVSCVADHCRQGHVASSEQRTLLVWFFSAICVDSDEARHDPFVKEIAETLGGQDAAHSLALILAGNALGNQDNCLPSLSGIQRLQSGIPGGRHDNDQIDYRSISIVPTLDEFCCKSDPYLPKVSEDGTYTGAQLLDRQFRLLREDIMGPSKDSQGDPRKEQRDIVYGVRLHHIETGAPKVTKDKKVLIGPSNACFVFSFRLSPWLHKRMKSLSKKERHSYWERNHRFLPRNGLVCLQVQNAKNEWVPIRFATIVRRECLELSSEQPTIGLMFYREGDVLEILKDLSDRSVPPTRLFVVSGELFAYEPILRGLKRMTSVPFDEEMLRSNCVPPTEPIDLGSALRAGGDDVRRKAEMLDFAQRSAVENVLNQRVALIQGPPGTGKTFLGVLLAQILLSATNKTVLVVTYTNHALDDFLEDILDAGVESVVRLGGRSQSKRLEEYNLRALARSGKTPFTREQTRRYAQLKGLIEENEKEVISLQKKLEKEVGASWWKTMGSFLEREHPEHWKQLCVEGHKIEDGEGFRVHGIGGPDHLWKAWLKGSQPPSSYDI